MNSELFQKFMISFLILLFLFQYLVNFVVLNKKQIQQVWAIMLPLFKLSKKNNLEMLILNDCNWWRRKICKSTF